MKQKGETPMANNGLKIPAGPYEIDPGDDGDDSVGLAPTPASIVDRDGNELCVLHVVYEPYPDDHDKLEDGGYEGEIVGHWTLFERSPEMYEIVRRLAEPDNLSLSEIEAVIRDAVILWSKMLKEAGDE